MSEAKSGVLDSAKIKSRISLPHAGYWLDPAIHAAASLARAVRLCLRHVSMDRRVKPGGDGENWK